MGIRMAAFTVAAAVGLSVLEIGVAYAGFEPVPAPGSLALLVTGVAGLAGIAWWTRRK